MSGMSSCPLTPLTHAILACLPQRISSAVRNTKTFKVVHAQSFHVLIIKESDPKFVSEIVQEYVIRLMSSALSDSPCYPFMLLEF